MDNQCKIRSLIVRAILQMMGFKRNIKKTIQKNQLIHIFIETSLNTRISITKEIFAFMYFDFTQYKLKQTKLFIKNKHNVLLSTTNL